MFHLPTQTVTSSSAFPDVSKWVFLLDTPKPVGVCVGGTP